MSMVFKIKKYGQKLVVYDFHDNLIDYGRNKEDKWCSTLGQIKALEAALEPK